MNNTCKRMVILVLVLFSYSLKAQDTVKACGHHDYPPWNWHEKKVIVGACAEITKKLFKDIGVEVDLSYVGPWARCQSEISKGSVDVNICSFKNEEREQYADFISMPMGFNEQAIFVKAGSEFAFESWKDLSGKNVAMVQGVSIGNKFDSFLDDETTITRVTTFMSGFKLLMDGRVDFIPMGRFTGRSILEKHRLAGKIVDLPKPALRGDLYISMSKKSKHLHLMPKITKLMEKKGYYKMVGKVLDKHTLAYGRSR